MIPSDRRVEVLVPASHEAHDPGRANPESPSRVEACIAALNSMHVSVTEVATELDGQSHEDRLTDLARVHTGDYLGWLKAFSKSGGGRVVADTVATKGTYVAALDAAGAAVEGTRSAFGYGRPAFCLVRPPGHHASSRTSGGYCFVNNVAVAAEWAIAHGLASRVAIVDFDVHHGDGTQAIFYDRGDVLYVSLHQWPWYPGSGALDESGSGPGTGCTVNIPLPAMTGDDVYLAACERIVLPVVRQFDPNLLLVSAGFDAHLDDPLGLQRLSSSGFAAMTGSLDRLATEVCDGRLVMVLEGGYNLGSLRSSVAACVHRLTDPGGLESARNLTQGFPYSEHALEKVAGHHRRMWSID